jgi:glutaconate CoA-transferase subunit A
VYGVENRREYVEKLGVDRFLDLQPTHEYATPIDMGGY